MLSVDINNLTKQKINLKEFRVAIQYVARYLQLAGEISVVLTADKRMRSLNRDFRGMDSSTDILTFPGNSFFLGEIFINLNDCRRAGKYKEVFSFSPSYSYLLYFLLIHGLLHVAGYNDESEKDRLFMIEKGEKIMKLLFKNAIIRIEF